jgi:deoxyribodipyrimidine photo-lyase
MSLKNKKSLFIFRRDLRLEDNTALIKAAEQSETIIPCFIFDPRQVDNENSFKSNNCIQFMIESLIDLNDQLKKHNGHLYLFYGQAEQVVADLIKAETIDAIFCNRDYTPFSMKRDQAIKNECLKAEITFEQFGDALLNEPEMIKSASGTPYAIFTAFFKHSSKHFSVQEPQYVKKIFFYSKKIALDKTSAIFKTILPEPNENIYVHGGRANALKIIAELKNFTQYSKERDFPELEATTHLSAHNKFGTISIRELYWAIAKELGKSHTLIQQLYWRDFFTHVAFHSPFVFGHAFREKYDSLPWENDVTKFKAWREGKTGFPIVDAGMRELNETGYMHNRVRMIVGSFLVKDLHIDWLWGEKYFAQMLVDYDPAVNNGNWQWVASTGCDAQPYFRIFNPWLQQKKFDAQCEYIKKWVPELKHLTPKVIHSWFKNTSPKLKDYPAPIVDHSKESTLAKKQYKIS